MNFCKDNTVFFMDPASCSYKFTCADLGDPQPFIRSFRQLLREVWRYAPCDTDYHYYARKLPYEYVRYRFAEKLTDCFRDERCLDEAAKIINKLIMSLAISIDGNGDMLIPT